MVSFWLWRTQFKRMTCRGIREWHQCHQHQKKERDDTWQMKIDCIDAMPNLVLFYAFCSFSWHIEDQNMITLKESQQNLHFTLQFAVSKCETRIIIIIIKQNDRLRNVTFLDRCLALLLHHKSLIINILKSLTCKIMTFFPVNCPWWWWSALCRKKKKKFHA